MKSKSVKSDAEKIWPKSKMNPLGNQAEAPKIKRGRGRPRGTKNSTKKAQPLIFKVNTHVVHPQSDLCNNGVQAGASTFHEKFASMPRTESTTNITIKPGNPIIYNYNYFWPNVNSKGCGSGMLGVNPIPISTQHNLEHRNEKEAQSLEQVSVETQIYSDPNKENIAVNECYPEPGDGLNYTASPPENIAFDGFEELQILVGNTVTISNLGQQIFDNEHSVSDQSATNLIEDMHDGIPEEVSTSQNDSSVRSGNADDLRLVHDSDSREVAIRAVKFIQRLENELGSSDYKKVLETLSALYKVKKEEVKESDGDAEEIRQEKIAAYIQQEKVTIGLMREVLKDMPDYLEEMETYFTDKTYLDVLSCMGGAPLPMKVGSDVGTCTLEKGINSTLQNIKQSSSQRREPPIVITIEDDEDEEPVAVMIKLVKDKYPQLITLDVDEDTEQQLTTSVGDEDKGQHLLKDGKEDQSEQGVDVIPTGYIRVAEKPSDLPLLHYCPERWVHELCYTLSPILIKIWSLRNFIYNNLHVTLFRYDDDCQSDKEEAIRKPFPTNECETGDEVMENAVPGTYSMHPATFIHEKCSGRTALCNEVLNDQYFAVAHRRKFLGITRNKDEERMDDYEDARFEVDMLLYRTARTKQVMKELEAKISEMSDKDLNAFKLGNELGGNTIIHQSVVKQLYSRENEATIILGLQKFPVLFVPGVLQILSAREREWSDFKAKWNDFISTDLMNFKAKYQRKKKIHSDQRTQKLERVLLWQNGRSDGK